MQGISGSLQLHVAVASSQGQIINQITSGISARKNGPEKDAPGSPKKRQKKNNSQVHGRFMDFWHWLWHVIMQL